MFEPGPAPTETQIHDKGRVSESRYMPVFITAIMEFNLNLSDSGLCPKLWLGEFSALC